MKRGRCAFRPAFFGLPPEPPKGPAGPMRPALVTAHLYAKEGPGQVIPNDGGPQPPWPEYPGVGFPGRGSRGPRPGYPSRGRPLTEDGEGGGVFRARPGAPSGWPPWPLTQPGGRRKRKWYEGRLPDYGKPPPRSGGPLTGRRRSGSARGTVLGMTTAPLQRPTRLARGPSRVRMPDRLPGHQPGAMFDWRGGDGSFGTSQGGPGAGAGQSQDL